MKGVIIQEKIDKNEQLIIELGCGPNKKQEDSIGIDCLDMKGVDIVHNLEAPLSFIPDNSIDKVSSSHLLEHINNLEMILSEIHRILKPEGTHEAIVPHFSNPYYYSDYTHQRFFGLYTFDYMATEATCLKRGVPQFYNNIKFDILERNMNFKSPFYIRNLIKQVIKRLVNINNYTKEFYEEILPYTFPCSEVQFIMKPMKNG